MPRLTWRPLAAVALMVAVLPVQAGLFDDEEARKAILDLRARIQANDEGGWRLVIDGHPLGWADVTPEKAAANEAERHEAVTPEVRLAMLRQDHVAGEVIYPTIGLYAWNIADPIVVRATCTVDNDWIAERLGGQPRIKLAAMIPT